jgi:hypothetical protein
MLPVGGRLRLSGTGAWARGSPGRAAVVGAERLPVACNLLRVPGNLSGFFSNHLGAPGNLSGMAPNLLRVPGNLSRTVLNLFDTPGNRIRGVSNLSRLEL